MFLIYDYIPILSEEVGPIFQSQIALLNCLHSSNTYGKGEEE